MPASILSVRSISKSFPGVKALKGVSLELFPGEILALIGENGAGKSTLMKILAGIQPPDEGELIVDQKSSKFSNVLQATEAGISLIHQELNLCDNLDLASNIFLGREHNFGGFLRQSNIYEQARKHLLEIGLEEPPTILAGDLTVGKKQMVEIAKALSTNAKILIMDEPTSSLSQQETENLFRIIRRLKASGVSIIYISHRLTEVIELADRVEVFRDGENVGHLNNDEITRDAMVKLMVGREINDLFHSRTHEGQEKILSVNDLVTPANPDDKLSFDINRGEIVGIAGLVGAGRTELLETLFGITPPLEGTILFNGKKVEIDSPMDALRSGLALVPEDRKKDGLVLEMAVRDNISLPSLTHISTAATFTSRAKEEQLNGEMVEKLSIKTPNGDQEARFLSGGNQQKIVIAKWLSLNPKLFMLDEPTRGVDVGAKREIYDLIHKFAANGMTVLFVSSEMEEVLGLADRIIVMHEGKITGELQKEQFSEAAVMRLATGTQVDTEMID